MAAAITLGALVTGTAAARGRDRALNAAPTR
jgi:hypothetical protein